MPKRVGLKKYILYRYLLGCQKGLIVNAMVNAIILGYHLCCDSTCENYYYLQLSKNVVYWLCGTGRTADDRLKLGAA